MVECSFKDPAREDEWNRYYSGPKLDSVLAVPGFRTSQRFIALDDLPARYLAVHSVASTQVLAGTNYKSGGGGNFGEWQSFITEWKRNLFDGCDVAPAVPLDERLLLSDRPVEELDLRDLPVIRLVTVGLDKSTPQRVIAQMSAARAAEVVTAQPGKFRVYRPIMERRSELPGKPDAIA
jgi:hypothetical protein